MLRADVESSGQPISELLQAYGAGDRNALDVLMPLIYGELKRRAAARMRRERPGSLLQPTALVNELYVKLVREKERTFANRSHFYAICASMMRQILIDHARRNQADRRGGEDALEMAAPEPESQPVNQIALNQALEELAARSPRAASVVELRFFGGLSVEEAAQALGTSPKTVKREWVAAKAWLYGRIGR